jgi:hypothetical protein
VSDSASLNRSRAGSVLTKHTTFAARYLAAKKSVDDRALNRQVWESLVRACCAADAAGPLRVLEIGAGIGTMVERLVDWGLLGADARSGGGLVAATITALEPDPENVATAERRLCAWAVERGFDVQSDESSITKLTLERPELRLEVRLEVADLYGFAGREGSREGWDLVMAHAVLDLFDAAKATVACLSLIRPGGLFYCTANFDGGTIFQPTLDPLLDQTVEALYHAAMDRQGSSQTGRQLFQHLRAGGAELLAAGSSDWVVFAGPDGYPADEAYFLHCILELVSRTLRGHPELDSQRFEAWLEERHQQVERGELVYVAHQLDLLSRAAGPKLEAAGRAAASARESW